ncbi:MAG: CoA-binding protein [Gammaproteobacteria bacterium]
MADLPPPALRNVAVLGASPKPWRYAHKAMTLLREYGYPVLPVHPIHRQIDDHPVHPTLAHITQPIDTLTLYVGAQRLGAVIEDIVRARPGRVLFNPGTENTVLEKRLLCADIPFVHGCTLVMLRTGTF